jgi:hypothetical protein
MKPAFRRRAMAIVQMRGEDRKSVAGQIRSLFHDLTVEIKEELHDLRTGEQPVEPRADLIVCEHLMGLIILLFAVTSIILLAGMVVIDLFNIH